MEQQLAFLYLRVPCHLPEDTKCRNHIEPMLISQSFKYADLEVLKSISIN